MLGGGAQSERRSTITGMSATATGRAARLSQSHSVLPTKPVHAQGTRYPAMTSSANAPARRPTAAARAPVSGGRWRNHSEITSAAIGSNTRCSQSHSVAVLPLTPIQRQCSP